MPGWKRSAARSPTHMAPIGKPAAQALGHRDGVGPDPGVLEGEEAAGAAGAALHLVHHEEQVVLVAEPAQPAEELGGAGVDPAVALDRLDEDRGRVVVHQAGEARQVVQLAEGEARHERPEALLDLLLRRGAHPAEHPAVEAVLRADHLDSTCPPPPDLRTPCRRESLISASSASAPLLQKKTRPGPA